MYNTENLFSISLKFLFGFYSGPHLILPLKNISNLMLSKKLDCITWFFGNYNLLPNKYKNSFFSKLCSADIHDLYLKHWSWILTLLTILLCKPHRTQTSVLSHSRDTLSRILAWLAITGMRTRLYIITMYSFLHETHRAAIQKQLHSK